MPKSAKKSGKKSGKGGKVSKSEKERLQKEEDEKRIRQEEAARLLVEKEEQERLEREEQERREQEEMKRLEAKDRERREDELNEVRHLLEANQTAVKRWLAESREKARWDRYMNCNGRPDPCHIQEVNTYISLWRDDPEVNAVAVLHQCSLALQVIEELKEELRKELGKELGEVKEEQRRIQEHIHCLQELVHHKHLLITEDVLNHASSNTDIETGNMEVVFRDDHVTLCIWAKLNKISRFKDFLFVEVGLGFELPKWLALSNVALHIVHTCYDHLSPRARLRAPSPRTPEGGEEPSSKPGSPDLGEAGEEEGEERGGGGGGGEEVVKEERQSPSHRTEEKEEKEKEEEQSMRRKSTASIPSERSSSKRTVVEPESQLQTQLETDEEVVAKLDMADAVDTAMVDLHEYTPLGGVFYCDVFRLPPQAIQARGWEMRQLLDGGLETVPCPDGTTEPMGLSLSVPDSVLLLECPRVASWDTAAERWTFDGVRDVLYEADKARVSFKMTVSSSPAFTLLQETYTHLPLLDWMLQPQGLDTAKLSLSTALIGLSITIQGPLCMLKVDMEGAALLPHLQGRWMPCGTLQKAMVAAGLNIFVNQNTDRYVNSSGKDPLSEHTVYEQMALLASIVAFSRSHWNAECGTEHMVIKAQEHHDPAAPPGGPWLLYLLGAQRCQRLRMTERSEAFSADRAADAEFHSTFAHTLRTDTGPVVVAESARSHFLFVDAVQTLLCAMRPLNYS